MKFIVYRWVGGALVLLAVSFAFGPSNWLLLGAMAMVTIGVLGAGVVEEKEE